MKRPARFAQSRVFVATLAAIGSVAASAQQVNPADVVLQRTDHAPDDRVGAVPHGERLVDSVRTMPPRPR